MEDYFPGLPLVVEESEYGPGDWFSYASKPMVSDNVIYWYKERGRARFLRRTYQQIKEDVGLTFRRTRDINKAEIIHRTVDSFETPFRRGEARWSSSNPVWFLDVLRWSGRKATTVHEIGHALGLAHPEDHDAERDTIMSYKRERNVEYFTPKDLDMLTGLYYSS